MLHARVLQLRIREPELVVSMPEIPRLLCISLISWAWWIIYF